MGSNAVHYRVQCTIDTFGLAWVFVTFDETCDALCSNDLSPPVCGSLSGEAQRSGTPRHSLPPQRQQLQLRLFLIIIFLLLGHQRLWLWVRTQKGPREERWRAVGRATSSAQREIKRELKKLTEILFIEMYSMMGSPKALEPEDLEGSRDAQCNLILSWHLSFLSFAV